MRHAAGIGPAPNPPTPAPASAVSPPSRVPAIAARFTGARSAWPLRVCWLALPLAVGATLTDALDGRSGAVAATAAVLAWTGWVVGLVAALLAHPLSLTGLRVLAPAVTLVGVSSVLAARPSWVPAAATLVVSVAASALALSTATADRCVNGASYGPERRFALRVPPGLWWGPLPLAWAALVGWVSATPLLAAVGQWWWAALAGVVGAPLALVGGRALHGLAQRVVVLVPAGLVLHDRAALVDPVLFRRDVLVGLGPTDRRRARSATDLTLGGAGLVLELRLERPLSLPLRKGRRGAETRPVQAVLFTPLRPGHLLAAAAGHGLPVG